MLSMADEIAHRNCELSEQEPDSTEQEINEEEEFNRSDGSEGSEGFSETQEEITESVMQEMTHLEDTFRGMGLKFRMIDRIGEGKTMFLFFHGVIRQCLMIWTYRNIFHGLQS